MYIFFVIRAFSKKLRKIISEINTNVPVYYTIYLGVDISEKQGYVDFNKVKKAGIDTTLQNAYRDRPKKYGKKRNTGAQVAWVPSGDTCPFCLMLASDVLLG